MSRTVYTSQDIEILKGQGISHLQVGENDTVTGMAEETARKLGITISCGSRSSSSTETSHRSEYKAGRGQISEALIRETEKVLNDSSGTPSQAQVSPDEGSGSGQKEDWMMDFRTFLDTADIAQIKDAVSTGLIDGIATNPEKVAQSGKSYRQVVEEIRQFFDGPIAVQAIGRTKEEVCECARRLHKIDPLLAIKITANKVGLAAVKTLVPEGIRTNATLMFNPTQALLAALAGSPFISPFIGRAKMTGYNGITAIKKMRQLMDAFGLNRTNLIAASIKDVDQAIESILAGAHSIAITFPVFEAMCEHPLTSEGLDKFTDIYETIPRS